ncbi:cytochrome-c oxidase, cbb3-type subunit III [Sandarakinorhabdus sp.]|uniref:cytochrome-c oxidase, cbb3-type subunit III n=1 Tax=Sandarakinorhabdus sp. TaxID=1916663 RepID=UPI00286E2A35|nr:cytochrome-c oxidase, cbb3-type subunit III [Sandarakinorhabdus sp.]
MKKRIDEPTGTQTVGHEWDGIEELDTPLPRWWLMIFGACVVFAIGYVVVYPAWPTAAGAKQGVAGWSSRGDYDNEVLAETARRAPIYRAISAAPIADLPANPKLLRVAIEGGRAAFKVHCVQCHGSGAAGSVGYPNLNDDDWLWGGDLASLEYTLTHGIRNPDHDETRQSQMPAFGEILQPAEIRSVVAHVRHIGGQGRANAAGAALFAANCAACHGEGGKGGRDFGAPNLTDGIWLHGGSPAQIRHTIVYAPAGVMPRWNNRLDAVTIRMLAAYVHSLGGGEANPAPEAQASPAPAVTAAAAQKAGEKADVGA